MNTDAVAVLGAGNTGFAIAANLTHSGFQVTLGELPTFGEAIEPIRSDGVIQLFGTAHTGPASIHRVTDDLEAAVSASDLMIMSIPAYGHANWARAIAPHVRDGQTLVMLPATLGSLEVARILGEEGAASITIAEADTAPYVCRKTQPDGATIWGVVPHVGIAAFPATETERVRQQVEAAFPGVTTYASVIECGLAAMNPVVHPVGVLMNAGRIERSRGEFYFYEEGVTPGVVDVILAVDAERRAIGAAFGYELMDVASAFAAAGFGPEGDLWSTINGSQMLTALRAPGALETRWLSEDVPFGLGGWSALAAQVGVETPVMRAVVDLGLVVLHEPPNAIRRTPADLGLGGMTRGEMLAYAETGAR